MRHLIVNPNEVIPWEHEQTTYALLEKARREKQYLETGRYEAHTSYDHGSYFYKGRWDTVPSVPIIRAPRDLLRLGYYVLYEGHHRWQAAKEIGVHYQQYY